MYIINTTYHIDMRLLRAFTGFIANDGKQAVDACKHVTPGHLCQVMGGDDPEGISLAWQQQAETLGDAHSWVGGDLETLHAKMHEMWGEKVLHFTTYLKQLD